MKKAIYLLLLLFSCSAPKADKNSNDNKQTDTSDIAISEVYKSDDLVILKHSEHIYQHISYLHFEKYGDIPCNGMIAINENEAIIFDTPVDSLSSKELINFINNQLNANIKALIPTHFHVDCIGGIKAFDNTDIPLYANSLTIKLLKKDSLTRYPKIQFFDNQLNLKVGDHEVIARYFGNGHTTDNIVGYYPEEKTLFGGCLIKAMDANKGNLADADTAKWSETVRLIKKEYQNLKWVIPGHGKSGSFLLLDYTIALFDHNIDFSVIKAEYSNMEKQLSSFKYIENDLKERDKKIQEVLKERKDIE